MEIDEQRKVRVSIYLAPTVLTKVDAYAAEHRWSRNTAINVLIEERLKQQVPEEPDLKHYSSGDIWEKYADGPKRDQNSDHDTNIAMKRETVW